jgi:hypothetical protein
MTEAQIRYDQMLERVAAQSTRVSFTAAENLSIIEELNEGMEEFLLAQKKSERDCARELTGITLNA